MSEFNDLSEYRPNHIKHFVGQKTAVNQCLTALEAWANCNLPFPHTLMVGPAGCGKTQLAEMVSAGLGVEPLKSALGHELSTPDLVTGALLQLSDAFDVLFIDEIHTLPKPCQTQLFPAMTDRKVRQGGGGPQGSPMEFELAPFALIAATTDEHLLLGPLLSRFHMILEFSVYTVSEVEQILRNRCAYCDWDVHPQVPAEAARRSLGVPRKGMQLLEAALRHAAAQDEFYIMPEHVKAAAAAQGLDRLGLSPLQQRYLDLLRENGPMQLSELAQRLSAPSKALQEVYEPPLFRTNLIGKGSDSRRSLRPAGIQHLRARHALEVSNG